MEKSESNNELKHENGKKVYEIGYLLVPTIAEEQVAGEVQNIKNLLEKSDVSIITEDFPKLRSLAYTMVKSANGALKQRFDKAYFGWVKFECSAAAVPALKSDLEKNPLILRFLLIETVRENTFMGQKLTFKITDEEKLKKTEGEVKVSEEELDKTLKNLAVE